jgi:hypothetical protein
MGRSSSPRTSRSSSESSGMTHVRTSPFYPQSNGKIERWRKSLKGECIRPGTPLSLNDARGLVEAYVDHYNNVRLSSATEFASRRLVGWDAPTSERMGTIRRLPVCAACDLDLAVRGNLVAAVRSGPNLLWPSRGSQRLQMSHERCCPSAYSRRIGSELGTCRRIDRRVITLSGRGPGPS